ncbi:polyhydroxyalkanoic acid system family protein [Phenylobacterium sp.]|uniref:polyhydroxyalkanoic acid system family protein n=1 Tax=Phenylobacterium sp. TaxID=1871053 RepID=UPI003562F095
MSKPITIVIPHQLGRPEARRRIEEGFADLSRHLGGSVGALDKHWEGDRLSFSLTSLGQSISGYVAVADALVTVEVLLPGFLAMIAGKVQGTLQKEGQLLLARK